MLTTAFWKKYFEVYDFLNELTPYQELLDSIIIRAKINAGDQVLDLGSGTGNLAVKLEKLGAKVTGIDFSKEGLERHGSKSTSAELIHGDITKPLPFADASFNALVSNNVLYAVSRDMRPAVAKEMYRVLTPGGRIVIANVIDGFKPMAIYMDHVRYSIEEKGIMRTVGDIFRLMGPTLRIFYYNRLISKEHTQGAYDFFTKGEQQGLLVGAGFKDVSPDAPIYSGQGAITHAVK